MNVDNIAYRKEIEEVIRRLAYQHFANDVNRFESAMAHPVSWLVAGTPFLAESDRPTRWAAMNLGTVMDAKNNRAFFAADAADTLESRISLITGAGAVQKQNVVDKVKLLLELILLVSYKQDAADDKANGWYNPLNDPSNPLDFDAAKNELVTAINAVGAVAEVDDIITDSEILDEGAANLRGFWFD